MSSGAETVLDHAACDIGYQCDVALIEPHQQSVQASSLARSPWLPPSPGRVGESGGTGGGGPLARKSTGPGWLSEPSPTTLAFKVQQAPGAAGRKTPHKWQRRARRL